MGTQYLIDTSAVIKYLNNTLPEKGTAFMQSVIEDGSTISFITEIELLAWNPAASDDLHVYTAFVEFSNVIGITQSITNRTVQLRKDFKLKLADAIIAATALALNYTLVSDNDKDFLKVPDLPYVNPRVM